MWKTTSGVGRHLRRRSERAAEAGPAEGCASTATTGGGSRVSVDRRWYRVLMRSSAGLRYAEVNSCVVEAAREALHAGLDAWIDELAEASAAGEPLSALPYLEVRAS